MVLKQRPSIEIRYTSNAAAVPTAAFPFVFKMMNSNSSIKPRDFSATLRVLSQVIADLWRGARELGIAERIRCGAEVVRVIDEPGASPVRVLFRTPEETGDELHSLEAGHVIFCTGSLQKPRNPPLTGEDAFGGQFYTLTNDSSIGNDGASTEK